MTLAVVITIGILGILLLGYLAYRNWASTQPVVVPATAPTPSVQPTPVSRSRWPRKWLWWSVTLLLIVLVGVGIYKFILWPRWFGSGSEPKGSYSRLPAEVALPIIAECESGGRHFEADGKTPLRNREGSSAIGKYQIMASLHEERAKGLGYDIRTEAGNEDFARFLYAESGTFHWEADSRSRACWEPKLMARGHSPGLSPSSPIPTVDSTFVVKVWPGQPAKVIMPPDWHIVWWGNKSKFTSHAVWRDENKVRIFVARPGAGPVEIKIHRYYDPDPNWWRRQ